MGERGAAGCMFTGLPLSRVNFERGHNCGPRVATGSIFAGLLLGGIHMDHPRKLLLLKCGHGLRGGQMENGAMDAGRRGAQKSKTQIVDGEGLRAAYLQGCFQAGSTLGGIVNCVTRGATACILAGGYLKLF